MTAEQALVGAMGCASWRARFHVKEYADLAHHGNIIRVRGGSAISSAPDPDGLNEVGVTDAVMATLWRFGPQGAAYAVSSTAEANHLGADIAIVDPRLHGRKRVLLYQAKLAQYVNGQFELKDRVKASQIRRLTKSSVEINNTRFTVTGRLALYQADHAPFLDRCRHPEPWWLLEGLLLRSFRGPGLFSPAPEVGRRYYEECICCFRCSPSGVLAAPVICTSEIKRVPRSATWPWEFDLHEWLSGTSPLDTRPSSEGLDGEDRPEDEPPLFEQYTPGAGEAGGDAGEIAEQLAAQLRLPKSTQLYVIVL